MRCAASAAPSWRARSYQRRASLGSGVSPRTLSLASVEGGRQRHGGLGEAGIRRKLGLTVEDLQAAPVWEFSGEEYGVDETYVSPVEEFPGTR
jgi:hypothetical protein